MKRLRNRPDRISLVLQDLDFSSIDVRDTNPFYSFFILSFYLSRSNFKDKLRRHSEEERTMFELISPFRKGYSPGSSS